MGQHGYFLIMRLFYLLFLLMRSDKEGVRATQGNNHVNCVVNLLFLTVVVHSSTGKERE